MGCRRYSVEIESYCELTFIRDLAVVFVARFVGFTAFGELQVFRKSNCFR